MFLPGSSSLRIRSDGSIDHNRKIPAYRRRRLSVHVGGAARRDRDHRHFDCAVIAGRTSGTRSSAPRAMQK